MYEDDNTMYLWRFMVFTTGATLDFDLEALAANNYIKIHNGYNISFSVLISPYHTVEFT